MPSSSIAVTMIHPGRYNLGRMTDERQPLNLSCLLSLLRELSAYRELAGRLSTAKGEHRAVVLDAARPYLLAALYEDLKVPLLVITGQPEGARKLYEQLRAWCPSWAELRRLPELDFLPYGGSQLSAVSYQTVERLRTLAALAQYQRAPSPTGLRRPDEPVPVMGEEAEARNTGRGNNSCADVEGGVMKPPIIAASALAMMSRTVPQGDFVAACHVLQPGMTVEPTELLRRWQGIGYELEDLVEVPGQMGKRGGIVDVFPPCSQLPVRLEFLGNSEIGFFQRLTYL